MKKVTTMVLMLFLVLSGALCYASGAARTENKKGEDGFPIEIKENTGASSSDKSSTISATIDGHYLTVVFTENLGQVAVAVTTASGGTVEVLQALTPTGLIIYIPLAGDYIVTFTLPNGDEYYGEFTVTD